MRGVVLAAALACLAAPVLGQGSGPSTSTAEDDNPAYRRWLESVGGEFALSTVRSLEIKDTVQSADAAPETEQVAILEPDMLRIDLTMPDGRAWVRSCYRTTAWQEIDGLGFGMLGNGDVNFLLFTRDPAFLARRKPEETSSEEIPQSLRGGVLYDTYLVHSKDGADERWYFNPETGMLDLIEGASRRSQFALRFSNYRNIGVFTMPLDVQFYSRGRVVFSVHRLEVQRGARLSPPLFYATPWDLEDGKRAEAALHKYLQDSIFSGGGRRAMFIRESIATSASGETAERSITFEPPSRIFIDTDTKGIGHERAGFDGSVGWTDSELQGYHVLKDSEIQLLFSVMTIFGDPAIEENAPLRHVLGTRTVLGKPALAVKLSTLTEPIGTFYFDPDNGHIVRIASEKRVGTSVRPYKTIDYSDFRKVGGAKIPFQFVETTVLDQTTTKVEELKVDPPIDEAIFEPKRSD
ncbi:MAG TPA: hypothetical protein VGG34_09325 [Opitutaceae bacterium]